MFLRRGDSVCKDPVAGQGGTGEYKDLTKNYCSWDNKTRKGTEGNVSKE